MCLKNHVWWVDAASGKNIEKNPHLKFEGWMELEKSCFATPYLMFEGLIEVQKNIFKNALWRFDRS